MKYVINWRVWHKGASFMLNPIKTVPGFVPRTGDHIGYQFWTMEVTMVVFHPFGEKDTVYVDVEMDALSKKDFDAIAGDGK